MLQLRLPRVVFLAWLFTGSAACDEPCPPIQQTVYVNAPDEDLQRLIADCKRDGASAGCKQDEIDCVCRPLCLRLLQLIDGFEGNEELQTCYLSPYRAETLQQPNENNLRFSADAIAVSLRYVPSRCDVQAR